MCLIRKPSQFGTSAPGGTPQPEPAVSQIGPRRPPGRSGLAAPAHRSGGPASTAYWSSSRTGPLVGCEGLRARPLPHPQIDHASPPGVGCRPLPDLRRVPDLQRAQRGADASSTGRSVPGGADGRGEGAHAPPAAPLSHPCLRIAREVAGARGDRRARPPVREA